MARLQVRRFDALAAHPTLSAGLEPLGTRELRPKGAVLFRGGEPCRGGYLLLDGEAKLCLSRDDGREVTLRTVGPGYLLGVPGTILNRAYVFTAKLTRDSQVAFIPAEPLLAFLHQRNDLCFDIVEMLGGELLDLRQARKRPARARYRRTSS